MNPLQYTRYISGYSLPDLSKKLGLSKQYLSRCEQGLYENINPKLMKFIIEQASQADQKISVADVNQLFNSWRKDKRVKLVEELGLESIEVPKIGADESIQYYKLFKDWREYYWNSIHSFSVGVCVHSNSVAKYEDGGMFKMPNSLKEALTQMKMIDGDFNVRAR